MMLAGKGIIKLEISQALRESTGASTLPTRTFGLGLILWRRLCAEHLFGQGKKFLGLRDDCGGLGFSEVGDRTVITNDPVSYVNPFLAHIR